MTYSLEHTFEQKIKNKKFKKQNQQNETKIFRHLHHEIVTNIKTCPNLTKTCTRTVAWSKL